MEGLYIYSVFPVANLIILKNKVFLPNFFPMHNRDDRAIFIFKKASPKLNDNCTFPEKSHV